jgi:hypothetical protein
MPESVKYEHLNWFVKCVNYAQVHTQPEEVINIMPLLNEIDLTDHWVQDDKPKSCHKA